MSDLVKRAKALREECRKGVEERGVMPDYVDACVALRHMAPKLLARIEELEAENAELLHDLKRCMAREFAALNSGGAASCDTHPQDGNSTEIEVPLVSGAVGEAETPNA